MIVITTGFMSLSPLSIILTMVIWESSHCTGKKISWKAWIGAMGHCNITEMLLKIALNSVQLISHFGQD